MRLISDDVLAVVTIWQEARGEAMTGMIAVGEVIRNRMKAHYSSDGTVAGTVLVPYQFSGWNTEDPNRIPSVKIEYSDIVVQDCIRAWHMSATSNITNGAVLYCNKNVVDPEWAVEDNKVAEVGNHCFYTA